MDVVTRQQALTLLTRHQLRTHVTSGRWSNPAHGVYVTHNGPLTDQQRDFVALLAAGPGSALGGLTALKYDGLDAFRIPTPVVVSPMGSHRIDYTDVVQHWSIYLDEADVHPGREPRRTRPARSVVDAASWERNTERARAIVLAAAQRGVVNTRGLREALMRRGACRHRALIVEAYLDAQGGIQSLPERDFGRICQSLGLPKPERQARVRLSGHRYYLDVWWPGLNLAVEVHGIPHMRVENWDNDLMRLNEIVIDGRRTLVFSSHAIRRHPDRVADQLRRAIAARPSSWT